MNQRCRRRGRRNGRRRPCREHMCRLDVGCRRDGGGRRLIPRLRSRRRTDFPTSSRRGSHWADDVGQRFTVVVIRGGRRTQYGGLRRSRWRLTGWPGADRRARSTVSPRSAESTRSGEPAKTTRPRSTRSGREAPGASPAPRWSRHRPPRPGRHVPIRRLRVDVVDAHARSATVPVEIPTLRPQRGTDDGQMCSIRRRAGVAGVDPGGYPV